MGRGQAASEQAAPARSSGLLAAHAAPDRRDRVELAAVDYEWPNIGLVHGFDHDLGFNPIRLKLFTDATNAQDQVSTPDQRTFSPLYAHFRSPMADLLGVRLIISRHRASPRRFRIVLWRFLSTRSFEQRIQTQLRTFRIVPKN
jgi:hypothetical protein